MLLTTIRRASLAVGKTILTLGILVLACLPGALYYDMSHDDRAAGLVWNIISMTFAILQIGSVVVALAYIASLWKSQ